MSNEEKILSMLTKLKDDLDDIKTRVSELENENSNSAEKRRLNTYEALEAMANLLDDDEKDALGKYMEEEMARKVALYG